MLKPAELKQITIFSCLSEEDVVWLSQRTADLHLVAGEYLIHEGESTSFFVLVEGIAGCGQKSRGCGQRMKSSKTRVCED